MSQKSAKRARQAVRKPPTSSRGGGLLEGIPRRWLYGGLAAVAAAIVVVLIVVSLSGGSDSTPAAVDGSATAALLGGIPQNGRSLGSPDAPVVLVEFGDLQCPFCQQYATEIFPRIVDEYVRPGKVRLEFRGLTFIGPDSDKALAYAVAAGEQDHLWDVVDLLYQNQGTENDGWVTDELLQAVGSAVPGLDVDAVLAAQTTDTVRGEIDAASQQAQGAGINSTPTFLAGKTGAQLTLLDLSALEYEQFKQQLDTILAA